MSLDAGDALVESLHTHNQWWDDGTDAFHLPAWRKSEFDALTQLYTPHKGHQSQRLLGLVGRQGIGKTTLLRQFIQHRIDAGDSTGQFLYLPFGADPLYQLQSDEQLARAIRYYESRVHARGVDSGPQFILLDDIHLIEHADKPTIDGWGTSVGRLLDDTPDRYIVLTASAEVQIERELAHTHIEDEQYRVQTVLPELFREYLFAVHPDLEQGGVDVNQNSTHESDLLTAMADGDTSMVASALQERYQKVAESERRFQSQVVEYLAIGGMLGYRHAGAIESARELTDDDYTQLRESVQAALYQDVPGVESVQTIADLERLCALAAQNRAATSFRYQELVELFDVDRRTIADSYLSVLAHLEILAGVTEYDNSRPRSVRLYPCDTGLIAALTDSNASSVRSNLHHESDLARVAAFNHTVRLTRKINAAQEHTASPSVQYWRGREGEVDFVFELDGTPIPIELAYRSRDYDVALETLAEFQDTYDAPVGFVVVGNTVRGDTAVQHINDRIVELPYWLYLLLC